MRNIIEKSNMTKFDYQARKLGVIGLIIISFTLILGGTILVNLHREQQVLMQKISLSKGGDMSDYIVNID